ncbi:MFS transporter [Clostridium beijerinckii]|jgi:Arabinose efflux permease|uniref:MFS transporter n=2 Tax=Clostridium TaxID=1485 RepID=A0AAV3W9D3_9CLOT|nr:MULTISPECIES: MFS transporter [Clostridium]NOW85797.1 MFS family permease [Clostridium beijerinckii]NOW87978.1 MFS family permease [Clostridium beijerinckii]NRZ25261.1 MFS family permease [Clostridium beijerinckii]NYB97778.1 MFS family permease [Clostridium beijerinckii]OOM19375.1 multidrug resistance protein MdtH [Clostridium beijerinckii]
MKDFINNYKGLPKEMYVICFATLINRLGDFVVPFLALYLTQKIGMTAAATGVIVTLSSIVGIPASILGGKISDMFGRKKIYTYAQSIAAVTLIPCAFTKSVSITIMCLLISTFFNGFVRPAFQSMIQDILSKEERQAGFSLNYLAINAGVAIGPIIAGFLFNNLLPLLFLGDTLTSLIAVFLVWKNIKETYPVNSKLKVESKAEIAENGNTFQMLWKRPALSLFLVLYMVYNFIYAQHKFSLPITLNAQFNNESAKLLGYIMSINAVTVLVLTIFIGFITKRNHQLTNMAFTGILYAIGFGMIGYIDNFNFFIISTIIWTLGEILSSISSGVYVANNSPSNYRARLNAIMNLGRFLGTALSTFFSGAYIQVYGYKTLWFLIFFISIISGILMFVLKIFSVKSELGNYTKSKIKSAV